VTYQCNNYAGKYQDFFLFISEQALVCERLCAPWNIRQHYVNVGWLTWQGCYRFVPKWSENPLSFEARNAQNTFIPASGYGGKLPKNGGLMSRQKNKATNKKQVRKATVTKQKKQSCISRF